MTESRCANNLDVVEGALGESMARRLAAAITHAPGFSEMPSSGQSSSAVTRASWASFFCDADIVRESGNGGDEPCGLDLNRLRHIFYAC